MPRAVTAQDRGTAKGRSPAQCTCSSKTSHFLASGAHGTTPSGTEAFISKGELWKQFILPRDCLHSRVIVGFIFGGKSGVCIISMLDADCTKRHLDQIKAMMNKAAQEQSRPMKDSAGASQPPLPDRQQEGKPPGDLESLLRLALLHSPWP